MLAPFCTSSLKTRKSVQIKTGVACISFRGSGLQNSPTPPPVVLPDTHVSMWVLCQLLMLTRCCRERNRLKLGRGGTRKHSRLRPSAETAL